jgi:hypothetical protein
MKMMVKLLSLIGLALTVVPAFLVLDGSIRWETHALLMVIGMVLWFSTAPFWMKQTVD